MISSTPPSDGGHEIKLLLDTEAYVTDLDFMKHITAENMLDPDYLKERARLIHSKRATDLGR